MSATSGGGRVRVVITGLGAITPIGNDADTTWESARAGRSGGAGITLFDAGDLPVTFACEVKGFDADEAVGRKEARRSSRNIHFGLHAAREAVRASGLDIRSIGTEVGVCIASGIGGLEILENAAVTLHEKGARRVSPFTVPAMITDMAAGMVAIDHGAKGPNFAIVSACASGAHAIGEAAEWIRRGDAVAVIAGGTEAAITPLGVAAFSAMQALSTRNHEPARASRPFDMGRDGFVMGEGAGMLVLEEYGHARRRGANILAEVAGYGATADAGHVTQPDPLGDGARRCVTRALERAGARPDEVSYINAHGTSTQLNDASETRAIKAVFGEAAATVPMSSTKSMTGHLLGAAGAVEAVMCVLSIRDSFVPPTINLEEPDPACDLDYVPNAGRARTVDLAISTSFGFGGHNACLALAKVAP